MVSISACKRRISVCPLFVYFAKSWHAWTIKSELPDRESNPGLPRDRRRSSPLDYRGLLCVAVWSPLRFHLPANVLAFLSKAWHCIRNIAWNDLPPSELHKAMREQKRYPLKKRYSFEPDLNQRPMDYCYDSQLQSTALPTELSKELWNVSCCKLGNSDLLESLLFSLHTILKTILQ